MYNFEESIQRYLDIVGPMTSSEFKEYLKKDVSQMSSLEYELYSIKRKTDELKEESENLRKETEEIKRKAEKLRNKQKMEKNIILLNKRYSVEEVCDIERDVSESLEYLNSLVTESSKSGIRVFVEYFE